MKIYLNSHGLDKNFIFFSWDSWLFFDRFTKYILQLIYQSTSILINSNHFFHSHFHDTCTEFFLIQNLLWILLIVIVFFDYHHVLFACNRFNQVYAQCNVNMIRDDSWQQNKSIVSIFMEPLKKFSPLWMVIIFFFSLFWWIMLKSWWL